MEQHHKTLTLKGVNFAVEPATAVKLPAGSTIVLAEGTTNTITSTNKDNTSAENSYGIYCDGDLTIKGSGTLNVTGGAATGGSIGIHVTGDLTIESGTVNAYGGKDAISSTGIDSESTVEITGGTVTAIGDTATNSFGIHARGVEISGGTVTAVGADCDSSTAHSVGIWTHAAVTISGDDTVVTAKGGTAPSDSHGIWTEFGEVTITGGTVTVTGNTADDSYGIRAGSHGGEKITISGGHVTATGKPALYVVESLGGALDLSGYTKYQWRTSDGGAYTPSSTTQYTYSDTDTYVEIDRVKTVINGNETADFTGDTATALDLITNNTPGKATWDSTTKTLTLNGVNFTTSADTAVKLPGGSTIVLAGDTKNTITSTSVSSSEWATCQGIRVEGGDLTIEGSGELAVKGGGTLSSSGISVYEGILAIKSGTVSFTGGTASSGSYGVYADNGVEISGGIVNATGGEVNGASGSSIGINTNRSVTITGGTVTARGGNGGQASYGINTGFRSACTVTGGDVTAIGGNASHTSYGIRPSSTGTFTISGGHVIAKTLSNASTEYRSALSSAPDLSSYASCYWRTGPDDYYYNTAYPYSPAHTYVEFAPDGKLAPDTIDLPRTGDDSSILLWIVLLLASGLGVTVVYSRRSKTAK